MARIAVGADVEQLLVIVGCRQVVRLEDAGDQRRERVAERRLDLILLVARHRQLRLDRVANGSDLDFDLGERFDVGSRHRRGRLAVIHTGHAGLLRLCDERRSRSGQNNERGQHSAGKCSAQHARLRGGKTRSNVGNDAADGQRSSHLLLNVPERQYVAIFELNRLKNAELDRIRAAGRSESQLGREEGEGGRQETRRQLSGPSKRVLSVAGAASTVFMSQKVRPRSSGAGCLSVTNPPSRKLLHHVHRGSRGEVEVVLEANRIGHREHHQRLRLGDIEVLEREHVFAVPTMSLPWRRATTSHFVGLVTLRTVRSPMSVKVFS